MAGSGSSCAPSISSPSAAAPTRCSAILLHCSVSVCRCSRDSKTPPFEEHDMDFSLTDEQREMANLAAQILTDRCTLERLKTIEASDDRYDRELWAAFAKAGLL